MTVFTEGSLRFDFDDRWIVVKYDADLGDYRRKMDALEDTKAVDFVAICRRGDGNAPPLLDRSEGLSDPAAA